MQSIGARPWARRFACGKLGHVVWRRTVGEHDMMKVVVGEGDKTVMKVVRCGLSCLGRGAAIEGACAVGVVRGGVDDGDGVVGGRVGEG
ncbi:hypothetical protein M3J09_006463 [Ascochyta lentis]